MKPKVNTQTVQTSGISKSVSFGIKASGLHHILGILRNQLYSDKVLAVIREYTCNAVDAHVEVGHSNRPIEVTLPNRMNPYFKVRDFGPALSEQEVQDVYAFYGESTKRNTNDQIGMLGIGSKAAFAYGDNYVINSFLDGKKHIYNAFIDETQVGQISKIGEESSKEKNGIEIVVPVKEDDVGEFAAKSKDLFEWFAIRPVIKGHEQFKYDDEKTLFQGDGWKWTDCQKDRYSRNDHAIVIMGNIGYPIDSYSLNLTHDDDYRSLLVDNLVLEVEIGDLEISASREKLQYTDSTRANIKKHLKKVQKELGETISKQFGECKTFFDAKCLYGSVFTTDSPLYQLRNTIKAHLVWNGEQLDGSTFATYNISGVELHQFKKSYRSSKYRPEEANSIYCEKNVVVIENDMGHRRGVMGKMLPLVITEGKKPFLIQFKDTHNTVNGKPTTVRAKKVRAEWLKKEKFDGEMLKLSDLPQHKLNEFGYGATGSGSGYAKDAKHSAKCFEFDWKADVGRWDRKKSLWWKIADLDVENESGVYVILEQFNVERGGAWENPKQINELKETFKVLGIEFPKHVYAFKVKEREKIEGKDGWTSLFDWASTQLKSIINKDNLNQAWIDIQKVDNLHEYNHDRQSYYSSSTKEIIKDLNKIKGEFVDKDGTMMNFLTKYNEMQKDKDTHIKIKTIQEAAKKYNVDFRSPKGVKPTHEIKKLFIEVLEKYSMLSMVDRNSWGHRWDSKSSKNVLNYINVIDVCNSSQGGK